MGLGQLQGLLAAGRLDDLVAAGAQQLGGDPAHGVLVLDEEDPARAGEVARHRTLRGDDDQALRPHWRCHRDVHRQEDAEGGPLAHPGVHGDPAVRLLDDAVDRGQAQPRALAHRLGREEGVEDLVHDLRRDAGAVVGHLDQRLVAVGDGIAHRLGLLLGQARGADLDLAAAVGADRVAGVDRQVHDGGLELAAVGAHLGQVAAVVSGELDVLVEHPAQQHARTR